ncbi:MAG: hypothetical protein AAF683_03745 [Pseudomonadota bacterium]
MDKPPPERQRFQVGAKATYVVRIMGQIIDCRAFFQHLQTFHAQTTLERRRRVEHYFQIAALDLSNPRLCQRLVAYGQRQQDRLWPVTVVPTFVPDKFKL